jgi:RNA polymerase sigma-70 factor (ECF subfamily)
LEQQDDAAVVKLALSKLNPRHREVLIASMYEEKSTEQIAAQVGLSENATRQLIFRARAAFKKALIGDIDTTGMSAAAILSVAARKAASEGKKVGAAALTLIALVVMSLTVFPALNRATTDQMAESPANPGSSQDASSALAEPSDDMPKESGTGSGAENASDASASASPDPAQSAEEEIAAVLESPIVGAIINSDSRSRIFAIDQTYTAIGDNGLTAKFNFNPSADAVFSDVLVEIEVDGYTFEFEPANIQLITGKSSENRDIYLLVGDATYLYDEFGQKWSKSDLGKSRVVIEVSMEANGTTVQAVKLGLYSK